MIVRAALTVFSQTTVAPRARGGGLKLCCSEASATGGIVRNPWHSVAVQEKLKTAARIGLKILMGCRNREGSKSPSSNRWPDHVRRGREIGPVNPQLLHLVDQRRALQSQFGGRAFRAAEHPTNLLKRLQDQ